MSCAGHANRPSPFELPADAARALLVEAAATLTERIYNPATMTVATLDRGMIEAMLPAAPPRQGGGATRLRAILFDEFLPLVRDYRHPLHLGHQRPGPSFASLYADLAAATFNPTVTMFEGGPYSVAVEGRVLSWMKQLAGFPENAVATLVNGGAEANLTALLVARDHALSKGHGLENLRLLVGEHAHYTLARSRHILGLTPAALVTLPACDDLTMDISALLSQVASITTAGQTVMAIVANAGSTANGAFDDLNAIADIAQDCGAWLHVDAAHGGAALLSQHLRHNLAGLARADSTVINPHKLFFVSAPCSVLLCNRRAEFAASLAIGLEAASYVIPDPAARHATEDGDEPLRWTIACTRFFAAFRLYAAISTYGIDGLAVRIEHACDLARFLHDHLAGEHDFETLSVPAFNMVCFRYHPRETPAHDLDDLNRHLRAQLAAGPEAYLTGCMARGAYWLRAQIMSEHVDRDSLMALPPLLRAQAASLS
nr:pyridoxal-dependent decarboxylase [uncultured Dongia sp.]